MGAIVVALLLVSTGPPALRAAGTPAAPALEVDPGGRIVRLDRRLDRLVSPEARLERIAGGFAWVEGPVWDRRGGYLLVSDVARNAVYKWAPGSGVSLFLTPSGYTGAAPFAGREPGSNGLAFDAHGRLVLAQHGDRRIARLEPDGRTTTLADRYQERRLNSPNDLVFAANGDLCFTDPPFGLPGTFDDPARELPFSGVFRLSTRGQLTLLTSELRAPNGLAFSPDERTLYVANADRARAVWMAYEVRENGALGPGRVFFDATARARSLPGVPDGLKVDHEGHLFAAGPGGSTCWRRTAPTSALWKRAASSRTSPGARTAPRSTSPPIPRSTASGSARAAPGSPHGRGGSVRSLARRPRGGAHHALRPVQPARTPRARGNSGGLYLGGQLGPR